tara:strand:- start:3514 stop:5478 length:1965 start_codon:yes stop_codon:yes gene_type:complete
MAINAFRSNNCFIACEELASTDAFYIGVTTGSIMSVIQGSSFNVSLDRNTAKQLGSSHYSVDSLNRQPDVGLSLSYIPSYPFFNEGLVNLADLNSGPTDTIVSQAAFSGLENASRNFYIFTRPEEGYNALSGFSAGDSLNFSGYECASVGNCFLTNYSLSYAVGALPVVEAQFVGSNMQYENITGTKVGSPAINLASGNANQVGELTLSGIQEFASAPAITNPAETGSAVTLQNLQVGGQPLGEGHLLQSVQLDIGVSRNAAYGLGSDYVYERKMLLPAVGSLSISSLVSGFESGFLSGIVNSESGYSLDLTLEASGKFLTYKIEDAKLQSYDYSMDVNDRMLMNASFAFQVSPNPGGLQISGNTQESLAGYTENQINQHFDDSMDMATNGSMLEGFTDPNGNLEAGGWDASRNVGFWGKDIDFTAVSVWNSRGYGTSSDYRMRGATAVTPRHIVMAKHFPLSATDGISFVEPDGTWISRNVIRVASDGSTDIAVALLDTALPSTIKPVKVVPSDFESYFDRDSVGNIDENARPICVGFDHEKKGLFFQVTKAGAGASKVITYFDGSLVPAPYDEIAEDLESGDSGNPLFIIIDGEPVLLTSWYTTSSSPAYHSYISTINGLIASVDSAQGISTGYTLTEKSLNHLNLKRYPPF